MLDLHTACATQGGTDHTSTRAIIRDMLLRLAILFAALSASDAAKTNAPTLGQKKEHPIVRPVCGALAACTAEALTMPIDITKVCASALVSTGKAHHIYSTSSPTRALRSSHHRCVCRLPRIRRSASSAP